MNSDTPSQHISHRFDEELGDIFNDMGDEKWEVLRAYRKAISTIGNSLGG